MVPTGAIDHIDDTVLQAAAAAYGLGGAALPDYRADRPGASAGDILAAVSGDWFFRIPALRVAEARSRVGHLDVRVRLAHAPARRLPLRRRRIRLRHPAIRGRRLAPRPRATAGTSPTPCTAPGSNFATTGDPGWDRYTTQRPGDDGLQHPQRARRGPARRRAPTMGRPALGRPFARPVSPGRNPRDQLTAADDGGSVLAVSERRSMDGSRCNGLCPAAPCPDLFARPCGRTAAEARPPVTSSCHRSILRPSSPAVPMAVADRGRSHCRPRGCTRG